MALTIFFFDRTFSLTLACTHTLCNRKLGSRSRSRSQQYSTLLVCLMVVYVVIVVLVDITVLQYPR